MGVQIIQDDPHYLDLGVGLVHQPTHLVGEVNHGAALGDGHVPPAPQRLTGQEQVARALPAVLVVLAPASEALRAIVSRIEEHPHTAHPNWKWRLSIGTARVEHRRKNA